MLSMSQAHEFNFNDRFAEHMQGFPEGTEDQLRQLAVHSDLLSIQGITRVLDVIRPQETLHQLIADNA